MTREEAEAEAREAMPPGWELRFDYARDNTTIVCLGEVYDVLESAVPGHPSWFGAFTGGLARAKVHTVKLMRGGVAIENLVHLLEMGMTIEDECVNEVIDRAAG